MNLLAELKRRNVIRAGLLYIGAVWALAQGIAQLSPTVGLPDMAARWFLIAAAIGFPFCARPEQGRGVVSTGRHHRLPRAYPIRIRWLTRGPASPD
jgi:hypothetical protein